MNTGATATAADAAATRAPAVPAVDGFATTKRAAMAALLVGAWLPACAALSPPAATRCPSARAQPELVAIQEVDPTIEEDIRYAGDDNFLGRPAAGYHRARCLLSRPAAEALARVQRRLRPQGLGLRVLDCYRPQRAVDDFVRWARDHADTSTKGSYYPGVDKSRIIADGYIAECSGHSRASTVDLTLVRSSAAGSFELDMGTTYDFFDPSAATDHPAITAQARIHRDLLRAAMEEGGFRNYEKEWWHYALVNEPYPDSHFDVPIGD